MYFDEDFLKSLPDDWFYAIEKIADRFNRLIKQNSGAPLKQYDVVEETSLLLQVFCRKNRIKRNYPMLSLASGSIQNRITNTTKFIENLLSDAKKIINKQSEKKKQKHYMNVFEIAFEDVFHFEFTEGDLERIQQLINELRDLISKAEELKPKHKQRLLNKLENVQKEFHKTMSTLDLSLGAIIETGVALGQFGKDVKPLTDRIGELASIILSAQKRAYGLPSSLTFKLLGQPEDEKSKDN